MSFRQSHIHQFHIFSLNVNGSGGISPPGRLSDLRTSGFPDLCFTRTLSHLCVDAVHWFDQLPLLKISQSREAMIESCHVILNENTVMDDGYVRGCCQSPALIEGAESGRKYRTFAIHPVSGWRLREEYIACKYSPPGQPHTRMLANGPVFLSAKVVESTDDRATVEGTLSANEKVCATCRGTFEYHPSGRQRPLNRPVRVSIVVAPDKLGLHCNVQVCDSESRGIPYD
jgi:hypothetical protein